MKFGVLALDYDGTIARDGVLDPGVKAAILEARARGIEVVSVDRLGAPAPFHRAACGSRSDEPPGRHFTKVTFVASGKRAPRSPHAPPAPKCADRAEKLLPVRTFMYKERG